MIKWLLDWWAARQRGLDMEILWPICLEQAGDLDHAHLAQRQLAGRPMHVCPQPDAAQLHRCIGEKPTLFGAIGSCSENGPH